MVRNEDNLREYYKFLRKKYREERDRRMRPDGEAQYIPVTGKYSRYVDHDPVAREIPDREPLVDKKEVLIVGGGWVGLMSAARLREAGISDFRIIDDAGDFGGAWYWNRYPGAQCDIDSYCYLPLLEETGFMPTKKYSDAPEIFEYATIIAKKYDLYSKAVFHTRVTEMRWDDPAKEWRLKTNRGDVMTGRFVIFGPGPTSRAKLPGIAGLDDFEGHAFHTSRWDYDYTGGDHTGGLDKLAKKKVAIIGTGCTAIQCIPYLADSAEHLYVVQRTPSAIDFRNNVETDPEWFKSLESGWQKRRRLNFDDVINFRPFEEDMVADGWTDMFLKMASGGYPIGPIPFDADAEQVATAMELADFHKMAEIRNRVDDTVIDEGVAEKLKAWYAHLCKRPTFNDEYLDTFNRPNVTLVDASDCQGVERLTRDGFVVNGQEYPADCIIFSTGFEQSSPYEKRFGVEIFGRGGKSLYEHWANGMRTFHGHSVHGFPNWFYIGLGQTGVTFNFTGQVDQVTEQVAYIIAKTRRAGKRAVEATAEGEQGWVDEVQAYALKDLTAVEACTPGYYNNEGKIRESSATFWGDFYLGGYKKFNEMLEDWRNDDTLDGMAME